MAWYSNLIDNFFGTKINTSFMMGNRQAIWVSTKKPEILLQEIPELNIVLSKRSQLFTNGEIYFKDLDGNKTQDNEFVQFLNNPNALQTRNEFLEMYMLNLDLYGNAFVYKNQATLATVPNSLWVFDSSDVEINTTGKIYKQTELNAIIESYKLKEQAGKYTPEEVLHNRLGLSNNYILGKSPIDSIKMPLSNIKASYQEDNVIRTNIGALGILSTRNKDGAGGVPMNPREKEQIQQQYKDKYVGTNKKGGDSKLIITNSDTNWQPMTYPIKDLLINENINQHFKRVIDAYGMNLNMFSTEKGSTFENHKQTIIGTYQNTIQPVADTLMKSLTEFLGVTNGELIMTYNHLPVMQKNKKEEAEIEILNTNNIISLLDKGLINEAEAQTILDLS